MKKLLTLLAILFSTSALADTCSKNLMPTFPSAQASKLCATFLGTSTVSASIIPGTTNSYDLGSAAATFRTLYLGTDIIFTAASAEIVPGATSLLFRNNADAATNLSITDAGLVTARAGLVATAGGVTATAGNVAITAGNLTFAAASAKVIPGATSLLIRNNADSQSNVAILDNGNTTFIGSVTGTAGFVSTGTNSILRGASSLDSDVSTFAGTAPFYVLQNNAAGAGADGIVHVGNAANATGAHFIGAKTRSTGADANTIVQSGDEIANFTGYGADGAAYQPAAQISFNVDTTPGAGDMPGNILFKVSQDGGVTLTQALKLSNALAATFAGAVTSSATGALGWTPVAGANTACNTTCTSACVFGIDTAAPQTWLACTDATSDMCLCAGAS